MRVLAMTLKLCSAEAQGRKGRPVACLDGNEGSELHEKALFYFPPLVLISIQNYFSIVFEKTCICVSTDLKKMACSIMKINITHFKMTEPRVYRVVELG